eukprot:6214160-Pleurochrysis_carterae.AAC.2
MGTREHVTRVRVQGGVRVRALARVLAIDAWELLGSARERACVGVHACTCVRAKHARAWVRVGARACVSARAFLRERECACISARA